MAIPYLSDITFNNPENSVGIFFSTDTKVQYTGASSGDLTLAAEDQVRIRSSASSSDELIAVFSGDNIWMYEDVSFLQHTTHIDNKEARFGTGSDLKIFHNGSNSHIQNHTGDLYVENLADDKDVIFRSDDGSGGFAEYFKLDGANEANLFSKNVKLPDSVELRIGTSNDLKIYHDGSHSYIQDAGTGELRLSANIFRVLNANASETMIYAEQDGKVQLRFNESTKFETTNTGVSVTGAMTASGEVTAFSDERLKSNIETLDGSKVYDMRGVSFTKDDKVGSGVIAQELEKVAPELVNNDSEYKSVAYGNITGYLIEAIKDLKQK